MADLSFDSQEAVPADLRDAAEAKDGKFVVSVSPTAKVTEFRETNVRLSQERDNFAGLIGRLKTEVGFDPDKFDEFKTTLTDLRSTQQQVNDGKLVKDSSLDEAVTKRTGEMQRNHQSQMDGLTTTNKNLAAENTDLKQRLDNMTIDQKVGADAALETSGVRPDAIEAVQRAAREVFKIRDGKLVPVDDQGTVLYGADGATPMTPLEWIKTKLAPRSPYYFKDSQGGGSGGGGGGGGADIPQNLPPAERMRMARQQQANR